MFFLFSCKSKVDSFGEIEVKNNELVELPVVFKRGKKGQNTFDLVEYQIKTTEVIKSVEQGRVDVADRFIYSQRKLFTITNDTGYLDAESLFLYTREGIGQTTRNTAVFFGRTSQEEYPFTISLVFAENTQVFSGKSKRLDMLFDIEGTPFLMNNFGAKSSETGFYIREKDTLLAFIDTAKKQVYIRQDLGIEVRKTVFYTLAFLFQYERYRNFTVNPKLIKGE